MERRDLIHTGVLILPILRLDIHNIGFIMEHHMINQKSNPLSKSPCISHCIIDTDNGCCEGCWRTLDEISAWRTMQETTKLATLELLKTRCLIAGHITK